MSPKPVELSREVRRQLHDLHHSKTTGEVTIAGVKKHAFRGTLVTAEAYAALIEAAPQQSELNHPRDRAIPSAAEDAIDEANRQAALRREAAQR